MNFIAIAGIYGSVTLTVGSDAPAQPYRLRPVAILAQTVPAVIALFCLRIFY
jgi:hypothetical protein